MGRPRNPRDSLLLGWRVVDGQLTKRQFRLSEVARTQHIVIIGKTGTGKTSLVKGMLSQDIRQRHGFLCIDLHGDLTPFVLDQVVQEEQRSSSDLSRRLIIVNPADPTYSVGLNVLQTDQRSLPVLISEVVAMFRQRWGLDHFGARTEELLRNCLWVLAEAGLTLADLRRFLVDLAFRAEFVRNARNDDVKIYFRQRYEQLSDAMQAVMREPILNKLTAFTVDPAIRDIVRQRRSSFDFVEAMDQGLWILLCLHKGRLGSNSEMLAALVLTKNKNAIFSRKNRTLFTIYADELQSLVSSVETFETLLSEARKFGCSIVTANQHLSQYPPSVRAALFSAGTNIFFRSSPEDAPRIAVALDGGRNTERLIKELPDRHFMVRTSDHKVAEVVSQTVIASPATSQDLVARSNRIWARLRSDIEAEVAESGPSGQSRKDPLEQWS